MREIKKVILLCFSILLGIIITPCLMISITDIQGIAKGSAYTILEPELEAYRIFGYIFLLFILLICLMIEYAIKRIVKSDYILFFANLAVTFITIFVAWPFFK